MKFTRVVVEVGKLVIVLILLDLFTYISGTPCDTMALREYGWCEQSECRYNCSCKASMDCKQYCGTSSCDVFKCRSHRSCLQRLHTEITGDKKPRVKRFLAKAPIMLQECPSGVCENLIAARISQTSTQVAFQNCVGGHCENVLSFVDLTKQFCSSCGLMMCSEKGTLNCTQKCVAGSCKRLECNSRHCEQACSHDSSCTMECPVGVETCKQTCRYGSTCNMKCGAKHCEQKCLDTSKCNITNPPPLTTTQRPTTTLRSSTTLPTTVSTTLKTLTNIYKSTDLSNNVIVTTKMTNIIKDTNSIIPSKHSSSQILYPLKILLFGQFFCLWLIINL